jgi:hypothetical protein
MKTTDWYRRRAVKCMLAADRAHDHAQRVKLVAIAQMFMKLSDYVRLTDHVAWQIDRGTPRRSVEQPAAER